MNDNENTKTLSERINPTFTFMKIHVHAQYGILKLIQYIHLLIFINITLKPTWAQDTDWISKVNHITEDDPNKH